MISRPLSFSRHRVVERVFAPLLPESPTFRPERNGGIVFIPPEKPRPFGRGVAGFTLVELLVVIAIVGLLATMMLVSLNATRIRSRDARRVSDLHQLQLALELFADSHNQTYPAGDIYASNVCGGGVACGLSSPDSCGTKPCMNPLPFDPASPPGGGIRYWYTYSSTAAAPTRFHLGTNLEEANSSLNQDTDCTDGAAGTCPGSPYTVGSTPVPGVGIVNPVTPETAANGDRGCQNIAGTARYCYDISN